MGNKEEKLNKFCSTKGAKRKFTELEIQCQTDGSKRRKWGPMDRHLVIINSAKLGCNDPKDDSESFSSNCTQKSI